MARGRKPAAQATETTEVKEEMKVAEPTTEVPVDNTDKMAALEAEIAELKAMLAAKESQPQVINVTQHDEPVYFLFEAEVADDNIYEIGDHGQYGRITGKTGNFSVPKNELSRAMDQLFRTLMDNRWIIVLSGLTEEEREIYGVNYSEGEYLDKKAFMKMVDLGDQMLDIYPKLCAGHKEMVAKRYYEAYLAGNPKVTRELVVQLNKLSKDAGNKKGDFSAIIELMNEKDAE